jgi:hypothetical protein
MARQDHHPEDNMPLLVKFSLMISSFLVIGFQSFPRILNNDRFATNTISRKYARFARILRSNSCKIVPGKTDY